MTRYLSGAAFGFLLVAAPASATVGTSIAASTDSRCIVLPDDAPSRPPTGSGVDDTLRALIHEQVREKNLLWRTSVPPPDPIAIRVTSDFTATQYAPWYPDHVWRGDSAAWVAGTIAAGRATSAPRFRWGVGLVEIFPRTLDEAFVVYHVCLRSIEDPALQTDAVFLETWVRRDGAWRLRRHTSEKSRRSVR